MCLAMWTNLTDIGNESEMCPICRWGTLRSHDQVHFKCIQCFADWGHCKHMAADIWNVPALCALGKLQLLLTNNCNVFSLYLTGK